MNISEENKGLTVKFDNCVLNGENVYEKSSPTNDFENICCNASGCDFKVNNCTFNMKSSQGNNQYIIGLRKTGNTAVITGCKFFYKKGTDDSEEVEIITDYLYLCSKSSVVIDGTTYNGDLNWYTEQ